MKLYDGCWVWRVGEDQPRQAFEDTKIKEVFIIGGEYYLDGKPMPALPYPPKILRVLTPEEAHATIAPEILNPSKNLRA
ncbi:hypothetical protein PQU92_08225 [Asticcacaulis sp. BYS171W]|uniref:Uncharacterized protein n=1 Tax=Asticcacaulis aquaticus TaxID=2984212 RepID=A0ABT5HT64_9CAUL|nr:hypothetical protein [Asticcacaulis aquaticus]MDC7683260.1 hypothetical protein [Asticcacaulis aquaticus]